MAPDDPFAGLDDAEVTAATALVDDAGCLPERARALVGAIEQVARREALAVVAGTESVPGSVVDARVARLDALIRELPPDQPLPSEWEVSTIFRISPTQARNVIRTYQVRHSSTYRKRIERSLRQAVARAKRKGDRDVWEIEFDDPATLEYAVSLLGTRGLTKSVERDLPNLTLTVRRDQKDRRGEDAVQILRVKVK